MIVVDASAVAEVLLQMPAAAAVASHLFAAGQSLHAPHLVDVEVAHVIRRYVARKDIDEDRGRSAIQDLVDLPIRRYPHGVLLVRTWALRNNLSAYDAIYVALAEALDVPLLTCDQHLASAAQRFTRIRLI